MLKLDLAPTNTDKEIDRFEAPRTHVLTLSGRTIGSDSTPPLFVERALLLSLAGF